MKFIWIGIVLVLVLGFGANVLVVPVEPDEALQAPITHIVGGRLLISYWGPIAIVGVLLLLVTILSKVGSREQSSTSHQITERDRTSLLEQLERFYTKTGKQFLLEASKIELGLTSRPAALAKTPLSDGYGFSTQDLDQPYPPQTTIIDVYQHDGRNLLILGDAGGGKSFLLFTLARYLLTQPQRDPKPLIPVIFSLSTWATSRPPLQNWLIDEFARIYRIPPDLSTQWIEAGDILPLLDGLDEMDEDARPACIAIINAYHKEHLHPPLVICCRTDAYEQAAMTSVRLTLDAAVVVQPLSSGQVDAYLTKLNEAKLNEAKLNEAKALEALRSALKEKENVALTDLATIPLMLQILIQIYQETTIQQLTHKKTALEKQIWTIYVKQMVEHKGQRKRQREGKIEETIPRLYSPDLTSFWLHWLAQSMRKHNEVTFQGEMLREEWLPETKRRAARWLGSCLPIIVLGAATSMIFALLPVVATNAPTPVLQTVLVGSFLGWCLCLEPQTSGADLSGGQHAHGIQNDRFLRMLFRSILFTICFLWLPHGYFWLPREVVSGILMLVSSYLLQIVLSQRISDRGISGMPVASRWSSFSRWWQQHLSIYQSLCTTTILSLYYGLIEGLGAGLIFGLSFGLICLFLSSIILKENNQTNKLAERVSWSWDSLRDWSHIMRSFVVLLSLIYYFGISFGLNFGLDVGVIFGLSFGLPFGLCYWLLLGLYRGLRQTLLERDERVHFNQGIHNSLKNGFMYSLGGGFILTAILVLSVEVSSGFVGLLNHESFELGFGLSSSWLLFFCIWGILWVLIGGLGIWRHYILRSFLSFSDTFPFRMRRFLDDAVSRALLKRQWGGYAFIHRRLLDYLADWELPQGTKGT